MKVIVPFIIALDQSTSATKALLFDASGQLVDKTSVEHQQHYPQPGWVEHDAEEIYQNTLEACRQLLQKNRAVAHEILCLSITNQRETVVVFERGSGRPLHHAIVWQCRRGSALCEELVRAGYDEFARTKTGLRIDTYFPASKLTWLFDHFPQIHEKLEGGEALLGTMDTYLIYRLTQGQVFATDYTNASRTLLYDIGKLRWDEELCKLFKVPFHALPAVGKSSATFGTTVLGGVLDHPLPICGVMGDSQAALFAERCFRPGNAKVTLGTGSSVLLNIGEVFQLPTQGMVSTIGWINEVSIAYAFEGIINYTGAAIAWLKDQLGLMERVEDTAGMAAAVPDSGGVYLIPAFVGLSAPYWAPNARGAIVGLSPSTDKRHVVRAALESIAYQIKDVLIEMVAGAALPLNVVSADGGMVNNRFLLQQIADITQLNVRASTLPELSALGAVLSGALGMGLFGSLEDLERLPHGYIEYTPAMEPAVSEKCYKGWKAAVQRVL
jgi:glycerol kinase